LPSAAPGLLHPQGLVASRLMMGREATAWTLPEQIAVSLGERILSEQVAPGNRIGEEVLAKEFRVSRGPIRDALKLLEGVGLVSITSRRGAIASSLTREDLREIYELRGGLLAIAVVGFVRSTTPEEIEQFRRHVVAMDLVPSDAQHALIYTDALDRTMLFVAHHCGNTRIARILTTLSLQSFRYLRRLQSSGGSAQRRIENVQFYRDLCKACERKERSIEPLLGRLRQIYVDRIAGINDFLP
jgi:DNA-binding GntR family transcriptional regulator